MKGINFFVKTISSLFILIFGLLCLTTTVLLLIKNMSSQESITDYVKNANIFDYSSRDIMMENQNTTLRQTIKKELLTMDIPLLVTDSVIDSEKIDIIISNYIYQYSQYILYDEVQPTFPSNDILTIIVEEYNKQEGKNLSDKQKEKVLDYIYLMGNRIDQSVPNNDEINAIISLNIAKQIANISTSKFVPIVMTIIMIIIIAILSICLNSIEKAINWCSKMIIIDGILLIVASFVEVRILIMFFNSQGLIDSLVLSIVENGFENMLLYGIILIVLGIVFMIISAILLKKERSEQINESVKDKNQTKLTNKVIRNNEILQEIKDISNKNVENDNENTTVLEKNENDDLIPSKQILKDYEEDKKATQEDHNQLKTNEKEEMQIVPAEEEEKNEESEDPIPSEIEIEEVETDIEEETENEIESDDYSEMVDENKEIEPIKKEEKNVLPLKEIKVDVTYPKKGKDIEFNQDEDKEEEIELL